MKNTMKLLVQKVLTDFAQGFLLPVGNTRGVGKLRFLVYSRRKVKYAAPRNLHGLSASSAKGESMHVCVYTVVHGVDMAFLLRAPFSPRFCNHAEVGGGKRRKEE